MSPSGTRRADGGDAHPQHQADAGTMPTTGLPALWQAGFERHWLPIDEGGGAFITATFGTAKALPRKPQAGRRPQPPPEPAPPLVQRPQPPAQNRFWTSVTLVLTALTLLFAASLTTP
jgi:hypothetical protein